MVIVLPLNDMIVGVWDIKHCKMTIKGRLKSESTRHDLDAQSQS